MKSSGQHRSVVAYWRYRVLSCSATPPLASSHRNTWRLSLMHQAHLHPRLVWAGLEQQHPAAAPQLPLHRAQALPHQLGQAEQRVDEPWVTGSVADSELRLTPGVVPAALAMGRTGACGSEVLGDCCSCQAVGDCCSCLPVAACFGGSACLTMPQEFAANRKPWHTQSCSKFCCA